MARCRHVGAGFSIRLKVQPDAKSWYTLVRLNTIEDELLGKSIVIFIYYC